MQTLVDKQPMSEPIGLRRPEYITAILLLGSLFYYLRFFNYGIDLDDEGFLLLNASSILLGKWPMADYFSYQPFSYVLLAGFFKIFGEGLFAQRVMLLGLILSNVWIIFYCARKVLPLRWAWIPAAIYALAPGPWYKVFFICNILWVLASLLYFVERPSSQRIFLAGLVAGVSAMTRIEAGLVGAFLVMAFLPFVAYGIVAANSSDNKISQGIITTIKYEVLFFIGVILVIALTASIYMAGGKFDLLIANIRHYYAYNDSVKFVNANLGIASIFHPYKLFTEPTKEMWFYGAGIGVCLLNSLLLFIAVIRCKGEKKALYYMAIAAFGMGSLGYTYYYVWNSRMLSSFAVVYLNWFIVIAFIHDYLSNKIKLPKLAVGMTVLCFLIMYYPLKSFLSVQNYSGSYKTVIKNGMTEIDHPLLKRIHVYQDQADDIQNLLKHTQAAGKGATLVSMSEATTMGYLSGLPNPTYYHLFTAEFAHQGEEERAIKTFENACVTFFVARRSQFLPGGGPGSNLAQYAPLIRQYLIDHYNVIKLGNGFVLLERKQKTCG